MTSRSVRIGTLLAWVLGACAGESSESQDGQPPACEDLRAAYGAISATFDQSCTTDGQCTTIGQTDTCDCYAVISGHCEGFPYRVGSATVAQLENIAELSSAYRLQGCGHDMSAICDCAPQPARCGGNGTCTTTAENTCFPPPLPDASPL